ncbi:class A beta-lactamase-related serine hydrolase [Thalassococcus sp. CAU 1522]|uniref:Class A beta-lactamase-related serine hydrolase n=1 Tax=Thalassococcus arenae TaxID=2851652 RepID=A0ABS6N7Z1_9RHOB|nr:serine hydrolase [Thalassococcus arenae]MBV2360136.1 class A beta-lactamase-related serine hydrolase [Thalassococcus arenae]
MRISKEKKPWIGALALAAAPMVAQAQTAEHVLRALLTRPPEAAQFAPGFLDAVPIAQLVPVLSQITAAIGPVETITLRGDRATVLTATHRMQARIALDADGRVAMLFFEPPEPRVASLGGAEAVLAGLGDRVAWLAVRDGQVLSAQAADAALAVGSAFKLGVLAVLAGDIASGRRDWADVVRLEARHKSLPSGQLQDMPDGSPLTLHTAAALMISISDNSATDLLIDVLGRDRVAAQLGIDATGFLTTREFLGLKADADARADWRAAPAVGKPAIAAQAAQDLPPLGAVLGAHDPGVEWYLSLTTLCTLIGAVADLPLMAINPGPLLLQDGTRAAYKGGSETGVLNFTGHLTDGTGRRTCVALTVNHAETIDESAAAGAFRAFVAALPR